MSRLILLLVACFSVIPLCAQWSLSAVASGGEATVRPALDYHEGGKGTVLGAGTELAYGFGGRIDRVSLRVQYDRYRDFNLSEYYGIWEDEASTNAKYGVYNSVKGWRAWQLTAGVEGPFFLLKTDARLRMHVRAGLLRSGSTDVYHYALQFSGPGAAPSTDNVYASLDDDPVRNSLARYRMIGSYGLSYRITPVLTAYLSAERVWGNIGAPYTETQQRDGRNEEVELTRFGKLHSLRLSVAAQLFGGKG